jgi:hypothetical protein
MHEEEKQTPPSPANDQVRSRERERQAATIEHAAHEESWLARLLRSLRQRKGRPHPGNPDLRD